MKPIKTLPKQVISSIAAGEVIQRPVDVIKELIENAIDATANQITIKLTDSGLEEIQIIDNGHGIPRDQLELALKPHTTSKLKEVIDLTQLKTHGFRGEALASISQVSKLTLSSRPQTQQSGYTITTIRNTSNSIKPIGMPQGTHLTVSELFSNSPVRKDFLKRSSNELRKITQTVTNFALAYPNIGFELSNNTKQLLKLKPNQSQIQRTKQILGSSIYSQLIPIDCSSESISITGFVSQPSLWTKIPTKQFLFINNRPVNHRQLQSFIRSSTQQLHVNKHQPIYSIHISLPPQAIDANIHPQKRTVEIFSFDQLKKDLHSALKPLLTQRPLTYSSINEIPYLVQDHAGKYKPHSFRRGLSEAHHQSTNQTPQIAGEIQQIANLYLLAPTTNGLLLIDQHALHERILYDQLHHTFESQKRTLLKQKVTINLVFDLDIDQQLLLEKHHSTLKKLAIHIEPFGDDSYKIDTIPKLFADHDVYQLVTDTLYQAENDKTLAVDTQTEALLASMACRMAIKAGDHISPQKRLELVEQLLSGKHTGTCPHGRPVSIRITINELNKLFKRT